MVVLIEGMSEGKMDGTKDGVEDGSKLGMKFSENDGFIFNRIDGRYLGFNNLADVGLSNGR